MALRCCLCANLSKHIYLLDPQVSEAPTVWYMQSDAREKEERFTLPLLHPVWVTTPWENEEQRGACIQKSLKSQSWHWDLLLHNMSLPCLSDCSFLPPTPRTVILGSSQSSILGEVSFQEEGNTVAANQTSSSL
jgi:hypothetical protein